MPALRGPSPVQVRSVALVLSHSCAIGGRSPQGATQDLLWHAACMDDDEAPAWLPRGGVDEYRGRFIGLWLDVEIKMDDVLAIDLQIPLDRLPMWVAGVAPRIPTNGKVALVKGIAKRLGMPNELGRLLQEGTEIRNDLAHKIAGGPGQADVARTDVLPVLRLQDGTVEERYIDPQRAEFVVARALNRLSVLISALDSGCPWEDFDADSPPPEQT